MSQRAAENGNGFTAFCSRLRKEFIGAALLIGVSAGLLGMHALTGQTPPKAVRITLDPTATHQTITGWEYEDGIPGGPKSLHYPDFITDFNQYKESLYDTLYDLGLNRIRFDIGAGIESTEDYWPRYLAGQITYEDTYNHPIHVVSSDPDPNVINWNGFHFDALDWEIAHNLIPLKQRVEAGGEKFYISAAYGPFRTPPGYLHLRPPFYARFVLAVFLHMQKTFGFVPDTWEIANEPDNDTPWTGHATLMGQAMVATAAKLAENGFHPKFVVPSTESWDDAIPYFNQIIAVPGALPLISELSYHRYGGTPSTIPRIGKMGVQYGIATGMNECFFCTGPTLQEDLKIANTSSWEQFALDGVEIDAHNHVQVNSDGADFRQYFKYIRIGAVRIDANSSDSALDPVAFVNANGKYVVVIRAGWTPEVGQDFIVSDLPAGVYGISYTVVRANSRVDLPDYTVTDGTLKGHVPTAGVLTIYGKDGAAPKTPPIERATTTTAAH